MLMYAVPLLDACGQDKLPERKVSAPATRPKFERLVDVRHAGFTQLEPTVDAMTPPTEMPNGSTAEGAPLVTKVMFGRRSGSSFKTFYKCAVPAKFQQDIRTWNDANMADWQCEKVFG
jgi:hypothetical protein